MYRSKSFEDRQAYRLLELRFILYSMQSKQVFFIYFNPYAFFPRVANWQYEEINSWPITIMTYFQEAEDIT